MSRPNSQGSTVPRPVHKKTRSPSRLYDAVIPVLLIILAAITVIVIFVAVGILLGLVPYR